MATIKERAHAYARERCCKFCFDDGHCDEFCNGYENAIYFYEKIAKEQREADIKIAQKVACVYCPLKNTPCLLEFNECLHTQAIRDEIEKGAET